MKEHRPRRLCRLVGHSLDLEAMDHYGGYLCKRCGAASYSEPLRDQWGWWHALVFWVHASVLSLHSRWHDFWERCPDCGRRFGRHDESVEHLPF